MIRYDNKQWWGLIFHFHKTDTFRRLLPIMLMIIVYCVVIEFLTLRWFPDHYKGTPVMHSLLGFVISLLLVFRTNTAYERWWEGRKLWGALVNVSRNLALKIQVWIPEEEHQRREEFAELISKFPEVLKEHLRSNPTPDVSPLMIEHQPNYISKRLHQEVTQLNREGLISNEQLLAIHPDMAELANICGGCERILKTPIPYSYGLFIKKFIFIYIVSMPIAFAFDFGYWSAAIVSLVFYVLASLELIAEEIEDPFGTDDNDLPTDEIAANIRKSVFEILVPPHQPKYPPL